MDLTQIATPLLHSGKVRTTSYYIVMLFAGLLGFVKVVLFASLLENRAFGLYSLGMLMAAYGEYIFSFGLYKGLECFLPQLYGAGKKEKAEELRNRTAAALLLLSGAFVLAIAVASVVLRYWFASMTVVLMASWISAGSLFFALAAQDLRSRTSTLRFGVAVFGRAAVSLCLGAVLANSYGYQGILIAEAFVGLLLFLYFSRFWCHAFRFEYGDWSNLSEVVSVGLPLLFKHLANDLASNLDRWCVAAALGVTVFGQYAFAMILMSAGLVLHTSIWTHLGPKGAFEFGRDGSLGLFMRSLHRFSIIAIVAFAVGWWPFLYVVRRVIPVYFPAYEVGTQLLPIIYWGVLFQILAQYDWIAMATKRTRVLSRMTVAVALATGALYGVAILQGWPLAAYAWIFVVGRAMMAAGQFVVAHWAARHVGGAV